MTRTFTPHHSNAAAQLAAGQNTKHKQNVDKSTAHITQNVACDAYGISTCKGFCTYSAQTIQQSNPPPG